VAEVKPNKPEPFPESKDVGVVAEYIVDGVPQQLLPGDLEKMSAAKRGAILFATAKSSARRSIDIQHADLMRQLTGGASIEERDTWQSKELAARALLDGSATAAQAEMLGIEAQFIGTDAPALAAIIIGKADAFKRLIGLAAGIRGKSHAGVDAAKTPAELELVGETARAEIAAGMAQLAG